MPRNKIKESNDSEPINKLYIYIYIYVRSQIAAQTQKR